MNYTYILRCADGTLYTGWTTDLEKRLAEHNAGRGAKYTRSRRPVRLYYYETYPTKGEAMRREAAIKKLTRQNWSLGPCLWPAVPVPAKFWQPFIFIVFLLDFFFYLAYTIFVF